MGICSSKQNEFQSNQDEGGWNGNIVDVEATNPLNRSHTVSIQNVDKFAVKQRIQSVSQSQDFGIRELDYGTCTSDIDIAKCPAAHSIRALLRKLKNTDKITEIEADISVAFDEKQYTKSYIKSAIDDVKKRMRWNIDSRCEVYSPSNKVWIDGVITEIPNEEKIENEWLIVQCDGGKMRRKIQRFSSEIRPTGYNNDDYEYREEVMNYIREKLKGSDAVYCKDIVMGVFDECEYSATKLLDDFHHLKYEHCLHEDDEKFDNAFAFFNEDSGGCICHHISECQYVKRHYRKRGELPIHSQEDNQETLLMDVVAMIHSYFIHSFEINRLRKEERQRIIINSNTAHHDDDDAEVTEMNSMTDILSTKRIGRSRFRWQTTGQTVVSAVEVQKPILKDAAMQEENVDRKHDDEDSSQLTHSEHRDVYEIGKRFLYWNPKLPN